jgi:hypothetical protein
MWQLMQQARTPESELWQGLRGSASTGAKQDGSIAGSVWASGFQHAVAGSRLECILKLINHLSL